jgi:succinate-semialdehyde dehydrogenase / glutarate-semialdehyde dehydrogenase
MRIDCMNPATGQVHRQYETMSPAALAEALARAHSAWLAWRELPLAARLPLVAALGAVLSRHREAWAALITLEMGKRREEALAEIDKCAWLCAVYAEHSEAWLAEETVAADGLRHRVAFQPLGVILSIMPWNFPFWQALRFAVPAIVAGNASLLKHARNVPGCAEAIAVAFAEAGFPPGLMQAIFATHEDLETLLDDERVRGVSLTGSTEAGTRVAEAAGQRLKKVVLELGGSDPFVVLEDADLAAAIAGARAGRLVCTGQSCIAAKRFIVVAPLAAAFAEGLAASFRALVPGDPADPATTLGPLVDAAAVTALADQVARSLAAGARLLCGGHPLERPGYYFAATVLADAAPGMAVAEEEVFGPVAPVFSVPDEAAALALANATPFGLGGSVWTRDLARGERFARRLEAGSVFVNSVVKSDPRMPFGGVKQSGLGRELSAYGLREFVNVQGINVYAS